MNIKDALKQIEIIPILTLSKRLGIKSRVIRLDTNRSIPIKYEQQILDELKRIVSIIENIELSKIDSIKRRKVPNQMEVIDKFPIDIADYTAPFKEESIITDTIDNPDELVPIVLTNDKGATAIETLLLPEAVIKMDAFEFYLKDKIVVDEEGQSFAWDKAYKNSAKTKRKYIVPNVVQRFMF